MKNLVLSLILVFAASLAMAGEKKDKSEAETKAGVSVVLSGSVSDENTTEALVGVRVELVGTNKVTYTDFDGNYSFENVQPGTYDVAASYVSYETKNLEHVAVNAEKNQVTISLKSSN